MNHQISIYKNGKKWANLPVTWYMQNVTGVPDDAMTIIRNFSRGVTSQQKLNEWTWEWQRIGVSCTKG
jgi:hypothetical protein